MNVGGRNVYRMKGRRGKRYVFKEKRREESYGIDTGTRRELLSYMGNKPCIYQKIIHI